MTHEDLHRVADEQEEIRWRTDTRTRWVVITCIVVAIIALIWALTHLTVGLPSYPAPKATHPATAKPKPGVTPKPGQTTVRVLVVPTLAPQPGQPAARTSQPRSQPSPTRSPTHTPAATRTPAPSPTPPLVTLCIRTTCPLPG